MAEIRLRPFVKNMWRSAWCSDAAVQELWSRHINTFAISFELIPEASANPKEEKSAKSNGGNKKGAGSWGRKTFGKKLFGKLRNM